MYPNEIIATNNLTTTYLDQIPNSFSFPFSFPFPPHSDLGLVQNSLHQAINPNNNNGFFSPFQSSSPINSTSDDSEEQSHQMKAMIDERKQRRMISNRESARRSRMRKQRHLDELWAQVIRLRNENHSLMEKLNQASECHDRVIQENTRLKEETSDLRQMITSMQLASPYNALKDFENQDIIIPCNALSHCRAESTNKSISGSMDLFSN